MGSGVATARENRRVDIVTARALAFSVVGGVNPRWDHVQVVGHRAEDLAAKHPVVEETVVVAAWLHDVGYGPRLRKTGHHALDGATFLLARDCQLDVVRLVAHHTGAAAEAVERGLTENFAVFEPPDPQSLDILTMIDLSVGPDGSPIVDKDRISEILKRYSDEHPVHRAVIRSQHDLLASSARAKGLLGLPDDWPVVAR